MPVNISLENVLCSENLVDNDNSLPMLMKQNPEYFF
jgi:hypothetical protein